MPLVIECVCLKNMSDRPTIQLSGVAKTFSLHVSCKESLKLGEQNLVMHSSHTVVFFLPRMNFLLGK